MMRRVFILLCGVLVLSAPAFGQFVINMSGAVNYGVGNSVVDQHGNLLVFDTIYTVTPITVQSPTDAISSGGTILFGTTGTLIRQMTVPKTRVTVVPGGTGKPITAEYPVILQMVGTGHLAVYAVTSGFSIVNNQIVASPRKLIAIDAGPGGNLLPKDVSGFLATDLTAANDVKLGPSADPGIDVIFSVDPPAGPIPLAVLGLASPVARPRLSRMIKFDGKEFKVTDVTLPQ